MKYLAITLLLSPMFIIGSCFKEVDKGYPKKIHFSPEGGTKIFTGEECFSYFTIEDAQGGESSRRIGNIEEASYKWLTVKQEFGSGCLHITAQPAPSDKKRKLEIEGYFGGYEYSEITVVQGR